MSTSTRGDHLLRGGLLFVNGSGVLGRLFSKSFAYVLDQIEERLEVGGLDVTLPDGSSRAVPAGTIESRNGSASDTPAP